MFPGNLLHTAEDQTWRIAQRIDLIQVFLGGKGTGVLDPSSNSAAKYLCDLSCCLYLQQKLSQFKDEWIFILILFAQNRLGE